mmetsp:Transcript_6040/g.18198  ORF Transcript_6040/g.18198 Transcript_6040/m.18198 type:complete len:448 (+) Transcript_6040:66-1409(+)
MAPTVCRPAATRFGVVMAVSVWSAARAVDPVGRPDPSRQLQSFECFNETGHGIPDCECFSGCETCGYYAQPTIYWDCITCADGSEVQVVWPDGTGTCLSGCYDSGLESIADCECHESCTACGYYDNPVNDDDCVSCPDDSVLSIVDDTAGSGTCTEVSSLSGCYNFLGQSIADCECHESCVACGFYDNPVNANDCVSCADGGEVSVVYLNGAGTCSSAVPAPTSPAPTLFPVREPTTPALTLSPVREPTTPALTLSPVAEPTLYATSTAPVASYECFDSFGDGIAGCECDSSCATCGYYDDPVNDDDCITCADGSDVTVIWSDGTGMCSDCDEGYRTCEGDGVIWCCDRSSNFPKCGDYLTCVSNTSKKTKKATNSALIAIAVIIPLAVVIGIVACCFCCVGCPGYGYVHREREPIVVEGQVEEPIVIKEQEMQGTVDENKDDRNAD